MEELVIQETDYDALNCKLASINKNYLPDPIISKYIPNYKDFYLNYLPELKAGILNNKDKRSSEEDTGEKLGEPEKLRGFSRQRMDFKQQRESTKLKKSFQKISRKCSSSFSSPGNMGLSFSNYNNGINGNASNISNQYQGVGGISSTAVRSSNPIMNIGTYLRAISIDHLLLETFDITNLNNVQVINLGCGSDLRYFQYRSVVNFKKYLDIDFPDAIDLKSNILKSHHPDFQMSGDDNSEEYELVPMDLNKVDEFCRVFDEKIDPKRPLVIISECCFCYIKDEVVDKIIGFVNEKYRANLAQLHWVAYDPISGFEKKFGEIMYQNLLMTRNLKMHTLLKYKTLEMYKERFKFPESDSVKGFIMWDIFTNLSKEERARLSKCEFLDELEELQIILSHYIIVYT